MKRGWEDWTQEERDKARGGRMVERAGERIRARLNAMAQAVHAVDLSPRLIVDAWSRIWTRAVGHLRGAAAREITGTVSVVVRFEHGVIRYGEVSLTETIIDAGNGRHS